MKKTLMLLGVLSLALLSPADLAQYATGDPRLDVVPILKDYAQIAGYQAESLKWDRDFKGKYGSGWTIRIDLRGKRPGLIMGQGIPIVPGLGNILSWDHAASKEEVQNLAWAFLKENATLFQLDLSELIVSSVQEVDDFWILHFARRYRGVPVSGTSVSLIISHGNLVHISCRDYGTVTTSTQPTFSKDDAVDTLFRTIRGRTPEDTIIDSGTLFLQPIARNGIQETSYTGACGEGYDHLLLWQIVFEREGEGPWRALVDAHTNAIISFSGMSASVSSIASLKGSINVYASPGSAPTPTEVGMPYADIRNDTHECYNADSEYCLNNAFPIDCLPETNSSCPYIAHYFSSSSGSYCPSATGNYYTRLVGAMIRIGSHYDFQNECKCGIGSALRMCVRGAPDGNIKMGTVDPCPFNPDVPDVIENVAGNNLAARTAYYHGVMVKRNWLNSMRVAVEKPCMASIPVDSASRLRMWLSSPTSVFINTSDSDHYYNNLSGYIHLQKRLDPEDNPLEQSHVSSGTIPGTIYHEMGHGIDCHDGFPTDNPDTPKVETDCELDAGEQSNSEAYADIVAALMTHDSCVSRGWFLGTTNAIGCYDSYYRNAPGEVNRDCTSCDGYRDINWRNHKYDPDPSRESGPVPYTVSTIASFCPAWNADSGKGPCDLNRYCEGHLATQAFWDFKETVQADALIRDCNGDSECAEQMAWQIVDRLFKRAVLTLDTKFYSCNNNGGSGAHSLFMALLSMDDSDGDLTNTPHKGALCYAFSLHGIADSTQCATVFPSPCAPISRPQYAAPIVPFDGGALLQWNAADGAYGYDILRSDIGADGAAVSVGTTSATQFIDESLRNGQTAWYRIVPLGASRSCVGPVSEARSVIPSASLLVLPVTQDDWLVNAYRRRKLQAWGGSGAYTWSIAAGALPLGIFLDNVTGELYGQPTMAQDKRWVTIRATDTPTGLYGDRRYNFGVTSSVSWLDFTPTFLPSAQVSDGTMSTYYAVELHPAAGVINPSFAVVPGEGDLPPGLSCGCYWKVTPPNPPKYLCTIEGRVSCSGFPDPCTERGLYTFTVRMTGTLNNRTGTVDRTFDLPVYDATEGVLVVPSEGTTAGGTPVKVFFKSNLFSTDTYARFEMPAGCGLEVPCTASLPPESFNIVSENTTTNDRYLTLTTPRSLEGDATLRLYFPPATGLSGPGSSLPSDFRFITPAYASSTMAGTVHIIDSEGRTLSATPIMAQSPMDSIPLGMALSDGTQPGRELYAADIGTGNLLVFSASESRFEQSVTLQDPARSYYGLGAVDVAVDSRGYAYVAHTTAGLEESPATFPPEPWNPEPGGISVVDLALRAIVDADANPATGSRGAPVVDGERLSRIGGTLYPYTISTLRLDRPQEAYLPGDGYPGEYAFVSGVGPQPPEPISQTCWCQQGKFMMPCGNPGPCDCPPDFLLKCLSSWDDRPLRIGIVDLNPWRVKTAVPWELESNPDYWKYLGNCDPGTDGQLLGFSNQGLDFSVSADGLGATVYAVSPHEDIIYTFDFLDAVNDPSSFPYSTIHLTCKDDLGLPLLCGPVDIKVQTIGGQAYALVANENGGALTIFPLSGAASEQTLGLWSCDTPSGFWPTPKAVDARGDGSVALVAAPQSDGASESGGITVVSLGPPMRLDADCRISLPYGPDRILIGPMSTATGLAATITAALTTAAPTDFTVPQQQDILIREWETVHLLQETSANPQAVMVNIDNFQRSVNRWMSNTTLQTNLNRAVDLYRAAYLKDHPTGSVQ